MRKKGVVLVAIFAILACAAVASANVFTVQPGTKAVCINASWHVNNLSETDETTVVMDLGPIAYSWQKVITRTIPPGGFHAHALLSHTTFENKGPAVIAVNCQRKRFDDHDWKIDAGSGKTDQPNYPLDHVTPDTYIEPGLGLPEGTERGIFSVTGSVSESNR